MRIVIAPDSFKGSLSAIEVAEVTATAVGVVFPEAVCQLVPMADGGEGTLEAMISATNGEVFEQSVCGPLCRPLRAKYGVLGDGQTAVIELAEAAGLTLVDERARNPLKTSTFGVGELMLAALDKGYRSMVISLGGSATNDGGLGLLAALGALFFDAEHQLVDPTGAGMTKVRQMDLTRLDARLGECTIRIASDVDNPLTGENGASYVFGPQKGASESVVRLLDDGLKNFASHVEEAIKQPNLANSPGAGAAGGAGFALMAIGAQMMSGAQLVAEACELEAEIQQADLVITGEGRSDAQTAHGKVPFHVAAIARKYQVPAILLSGSYDASCTVLADHFVSLHAAVTGPTTLEQAMNNARQNLFAAALNVAKTVRLCIANQS
ncbi:glycerate kinase [Alicyclobacillus fodiniaquatilis]|uniref:Glycerate kinase n=1 Tax=Alicyclobacillus fodiniaquatilis TaxID=1661150 RepID=A0ABW4JDY2_9BACL